MRWLGLAVIVTLNGGREVSGQAPPPPSPPPAPAMTSPAPVIRPVAPFQQAQFDAELAVAQDLLATHLRALALTTAGVDGDEREMLVWDSAVYGGKVDYYDWFTEVPAFRDMVRYATRPLSVEGRPIAEKVRADADGRFGKATCDGSAPLLLHGYDRRSAVSPMAYTFFREHEYGHFALKHSPCPPSGPGVDRPTIRQRELDADCYAARSLVAEGSWGTMVVGVAIDRLAQLKLKESGTHPSSQARVQNLMQCHPTGRIK